MKKRILALILALVMVLALVACGGSNNTASDNAPAPAQDVESTPAPEPTPTPEPEPTPTPEPASTSETYVNSYGVTVNRHKIGDKIETDIYTFTLTNAGFAEELGVDSLLEADKFLTPDGNTMIAARDGYQWLYYEVEFEFHGTEYIDYFTDFMAAVSYLDYTFYDDCIFCYYDSKESQWYGIYSGFEAPIPNLVMGGLKLDPFVDDGKTFKVRGAILVPEKAIADIENPIYLGVPYYEDVKRENHPLAEFEVAR